MNLCRKTDRTTTPKTKGVGELVRTCAMGSKDPPSSHKFHTQTTCASHKISQVRTSNRIVGEITREDMRFNAFGIPESL